ncbi:MAG: L-glutamate gamma-semialdehyde dehydrogenase [Deinococcota bacterium]
MSLFEPYKIEPYSDFTNDAVVSEYKAALEQVRSNLGQDYPLTVGGKTINEQWLTSYDPCNKDNVVGRTAKATQQDVERAFDVAYEAYASWSQWDMAARARCLVKLAAIMRRRKFELAAWETFEAAKNYREAEADVAEAIDFCEYYARQALHLAEPVTTYDYPGEENTSMLQPISVGVVISPWNFLLAIMVGTTVAPIAVGNTVLLKPSPATPIIAHIFMDCLREAGVPEGVVTLLTGDDAELGDYLVDHMRTRFINFTGSMEIGMRINERAAKVQPGQRWLKRAFLEMGGKDALIVDETADLELAASAAVAGGYGFQGQKCSAMSRLIVVSDVYDELLERVAAGVDNLSVGLAEDNADVAAVINQKAEDKILHYLELGKVEAKLVRGGSKVSGLGEKGHFIEPTLFANVAQSATIACEEIFGPVVAVMKARDFDHALQLANGTMFGLTGGLISQDRTRLERARREFHVGNLYLNRKITGALVGIQPFGGFNMSGTNSKAGGPDYLRLFMEMKTVAERF